MNTKLYGRDPRTIAREISGVFDSIFPYLIPGIVANINRLSEPLPGLRLIPPNYWKASRLQKAMLFEIAFSYAESKLQDYSFPGWGELLTRATQKQKFYYDAQIPQSIEEVDKSIIEIVSDNLIKALLHYAHKNNANIGDIVINPKIPGFNWIASGAGDFSLGTSLIEIKCSGKNFSSADYRQVLMYWILSYLNSVDRDGEEWKVCVMINPRLNKFLDITFNELIELTSPLGSKVELIESFRAAIDSETIP